MSDSTAVVPAPRLVRPRTVIVGSMFASAAAAVAFMGLIGIYLVERGDARAAGRQWFAPGDMERARPVRPLSRRSSSSS